MNCETGRAQPDAARMHAALGGALTAVESPTRYASSRPRISSTQLVQTSTRGGLAYQLINAPDAATESFLTATTSTLAIR